MPACPAIPARSQSTGSAVWRTRSWIGAGASLKRRWPEALPDPSSCARARSWQMALPGDTSGAGGWRRRAARAGVATPAAEVRTTTPRESTPPAAGTRSPRCRGSPAKGGSGSSSRIRRRLVRQDRLRIGNSSACDRRPLPALLTAYRAPYRGREDLAGRNRARVAGDGHGGRRPGRGHDRRGARDGEPDRRPATRLLPSEAKKSDRPARENCQTMATLLCPGGVST